MQPDAVVDDDEDVFDTPDTEADEAAWLRGEADHAAGRTVSNEAVMRWLETWGTPNRLPRPKCGE